MGTSTIVDSFEREVDPGWGSTDTGHTWLLNGGLTSDRTVAGGAGRVTLAADPGNIREQRLSRPWTNGEVLVQIVAGQVSATSAVLPSALLRRDPANSSNFYRARVHLNVGGTVSLSVTRGITQVGTTAATGVTYTAGTRLWLRARVDGHQVRARVWQDGLAEPGTWQADQTVVTDPINVGDMGVTISSFSDNTNVAPWVEVRRLEISYDLEVDNRLAGDAGVQVSDTTLAASASAGTVTIDNAGPAAAYSSAHTVHDLPMIELASGHHMDGTDTAAGDPTARLLAGTLGSTWAVRVYLRTASLQAAGFGTNEVRWLLDVAAADGVILNETSGGGALVRLQDRDLAATPVNASGSATVPLDQLLRLELRCDGTNITSRIYPGHALTPVREATYTGHAWTGALAITGYRYRIRPTLRLGDQGAEVTDLQNDLIDLGENLDPWGADGDFGELTQDAVENQQTGLGVAPVDGQAGPETRAAMDLALGRVPDPLWVSHLAVSDGQWIGPAEPEVTDVEEASQLRVGFLPI